MNSGHLTTLCAAAPADVPGLGRDALAQLDFMPTGFHRAAPGATSRLRRELRSVTASPREWRGRFATEIGLALVAGVAAFVLAAVLAVARGAAPGHAAP